MGITINTKILLSLVSILAAGALVVGATFAFFSDSETSEDNTFTAGTIDISVDDSNPWSVEEPVTVDDMKPSFVRWTRHTVTNVGNNPLRLWKHIKDVQTSNNDWSEQECTEAGGTWVDPDGCDAPETNQNNIDEFIEYDMYIGGTVDGDQEDNWLGGQNDGGQVVISEDDGITINDIESAYVFLGELQPDQSIVVWQSYHMKDETGNWAQTDQLTLTIEFYAEQVNGTGPIPGGQGTQTLFLDNKDGNYDPIIGDGTWGVLNWAGDGTTFDFSTTLTAHGLIPDTSYSLIYYADPWPGNNPGALLGTGTSDASGDLAITGNVNLGIDLPDPADANAPLGAKIWLVPSSDYNGSNALTAWNPSEYLFESNLIKYDDTDN